MTQDDAIRILERMQEPEPWDQPITHEEYEALEMAIETLETDDRNSDRCPVGGVDRSGENDRITLPIAVETPFWMAVWATEPERRIDVNMSYSDLKIICDLIEEKRRNEKQR